MGACHHGATQGRDSMNICRMQRGLVGSISDGVCKVPSAEAEAQSPGLGAEAQGGKTDAHPLLLQVWAHSGLRH